jgi:predicted RNase H-like nuclease
MVLIDQPTIVKNAEGQRPVETIVSSVIGARYGGMQPAYTGKAEMFGCGARIWPFLTRFGGAADPLVRSTGTRVIETYPVLMMISLGWMLPDSRPGGRLPKYNPDRRATFSRSDWEHVCIRARDAFIARGVAGTSQWLDQMALIQAPRKSDQDRVDAVLCLLVAMYLASGEECLMVGDQETGYIVVPHSLSLCEELERRCGSTGHLASDWVRVLRNVAVRPVAAC